MGKVTKFTPIRPFTTLASLNIDSTGQGPGSIITATGSNGELAWSSNVALITSNTSNALLGPFVNLQSGTGTTFAVASNTLTISSTATGGAGTTFADLGWFNVEDYGAVHDGVTDDTTAIQDAINACFAAGGGTIYFPANRSAMPTIYQIDGALQDTGTYNSQLEIPQNSSGLLSLRFLGNTSVKLRSSWNGVISGTPSVISAGTHDSHTLNRVFVRFDKFRIEVHDNPKLTAIDMTKAATCRWDGLSIAPYGTYTTSVPTNANAIGLDLPWAINDQNSGGTDLYIDGFYTGLRPGEQMVADAVYISYCARAVEFRGAIAAPDYLQHAAQIQRLNVWYCNRALVFSGDTRAVYIDLMDVEHDDPAPWDVVYDIDDASNYGRGFIGWHTSSYGVGPSDDLLVNGGTGLSLHGGYARRWKLVDTVEVPDAASTPATPTDGGRLYSTGGKPHWKSESGTDYDLTSGASILTTKGDILSHTGTTQARVAVGSNTGMALVTDLNYVEGVRWGKNVGEVLITDTPAGTPLVFTDLMQNEAQNDLLYEDP